MQTHAFPDPQPTQSHPAAGVSDRLSEDLVADAVASLPSGRELRHDGWTPDRIRIFLDVLSQCGVVEDAARAAGMSKQGAYAFRNSARGRAFGVAWRSAQLLARNRIADDVMSRAIHGCREVIIRDGEVWGERHRFDNRLTMAVLARLDQLAGPNVGQDDEAPRRVAHEFEALVDAVCAGGEEGMAFIESRCELDFHDFAEARILERNQAYANSREAANAEADGREPETSSTLTEVSEGGQAAHFPLPPAGGAGVGIPTPQNASDQRSNEATEPPPPDDGLQPETSSTSPTPFGPGLSRPPTALEEQNRRNSLRPAQAERKAAQRRRPPSHPSPSPTPTAEAA